ncbi:hypothetical protein FZEAL_9461 [Fusarium zealandicum]|uniref:VOC domain-containing protein n=1 Tax=Fusarium zealandicum TaxID=1053134 RepID=A0A8H4XG35_9HYPO|nr:hypothetical protein FZEAL_9461 [Fusarium zealandicum]
MVHFSLKPSWALVPLFASQAWGCGPVTRAASDTSPYPSMKIGSDTPADPATTGYNLNHLCLNVRDLDASIDFYSKIFGLRELFQLQTAMELNREKNNAQGLLELVHADVPDNHLPASGEQPNPFGHVGMIVPDINAAQARLDTFPEVRVLKRMGEALSHGTEIANATSLSPAMVAQLDPVERAVLLKTLSQLNSPLIYLTDPDGNLVELQPQN